MLRCSAICGCVVVGAADLLSWGNRYIFARADEQTLVDIDGVGPEMAASLLAFFADPANRTMLDELVAAGLRPTPETTLATSEASALSGKTVVLTGTLSIARNRKRNSVCCATGGAKKVGFATAELLKFTWGPLSWRHSSLTGP